LWPEILCTVGRSIPAWTRWVMAVCRKVCGTICFGSRSAALTTSLKAYSGHLIWPHLDRDDGNSHSCLASAALRYSARYSARFFYWLLVCSCLGMWDVNNSTL